MNAEKDSMDDKGKIAASAVMKIRRATGLGVLDAKQLLLTASPLFRERLELAAECQCTESDGILHDPIEDDSQIKAIIEQAGIEAEIRLSGERRRMGLCHLYWTTKKAILKEKHGIDWFTPVEMNPGRYFD